MTCKCKKCINCCKHLPGVFMPDEIQKTANYLKLPLKEFLEKHCVAGYREGITIAEKKYGRIEFVYPAKRGWEGKVEDWGYPFLKRDCTFLEKGLCNIHPAKPFECLEVFGCDKESRSTKIKRHSLTQRNFALLEWHKNRSKLPKEIKEFITRG